ncbi:MAG: glycosyltransferase family 4 protein [Deltaproteobacteria bacterium]|nr:glycosyltransferase family 4 protein [Deltaproteobacteria bacterium]
MSSNLNIFYINGDEVERAADRLGGKLPYGAHNVICPQWELGIYPREWIEHLNRFDEIWAPSRFVVDSLEKATTKPVFHLPLAVQIKLSSLLGRRYFGLPESAYLFLFCFDFRSYISRKNPLAAIQAFDEVCAARSREGMRLVIKLHGASSSAKSRLEFQEFITEVNKYGCIDRLIIIDDVFTDNEIKNLVRCCDCFVSLHRSEGFGRGMAEAMLLSKPVVATGYSGNLDFMDDQNSCLVRHKLVDVPESAYPHAKGQVWAEPDIDSAVSHMLKLLDDRDYGRALGQIASRHIRTYFSYRAIGLRYKRRIDEILQRRIVPEMTGTRLCVQPEVEPASMMARDETCQATRDGIAK